MTHWIPITLVTAMTWLPVVAAPAAQADDPPAGTETGESTSGEDAATTEIAYHRSVLQNAAIDEPTRLMAAQRLRAMATDDALTALNDALRSTDSGQIRPVSDVLRDAPDTRAVPALIDALTQADTAEPDLIEALIATLAAHDTTALEALSVRAMDRDRPDSERLASIRTLGAFPTVESGDRLMDLASPGRNESAAVRSAAFAGLRRLAPTDFGTNFDAWKQWWNDARRKPRLQWVLEQNRRDRERIAELAEANAALADRFVALLRDHYLTLELDGQFARLVLDLRDALPAVRLFALDRVELLLRDSVQIPELVQQPVASALDDELAAARQRGARILDQIEYPRLAEMLASRLGDESAPEVAIAYLGVLSRRPTATALDPMLARLDDAATADAATAALWAHARLPAFDAAARARFRTAIAAAIDRARTPALLRLMAAIGDDADVARFDAEIEQLPPEEAAAIAEGFLARDLDDLVIAHASVPSIYPHAMTAYGRGPATLDAMTALIALAPESEAHAQRWDRAVRELGDRLPSADLLAVDDLLRDAEHAGPLLRETLLLSGAAREPDAIAAADRVALLKRLLPILMARSEWQRAHDLVALVNGAMTDTELQEYAFTIALRLDLYDEAAAIRGEAESWIAALARLLDDAAPTALDEASRLRDEIARRFVGAFTEAQRIAFDELSQRILARLADPSVANRAQVP